MHCIFLDSINDITHNVWDALWPSDYPFTQHSFIYALENTGCTTKESGWIPKHLIIVNDKNCSLNSDNVIAVMPMYQKNHSYGEYVFDWAWADAYEKNGFAYYPKLVNAIPFTPATGPRFGLSPTLSSEQANACLDNLKQSIENLLTKINGSGFHCLFPNDKSSDYISRLKYSERLGCQFHWFNQSYKDFEDFLASFSSRKRKNLNKERKKVIDQNIKLQFRDASEVRTREWQQFYQLYQRTYFKRSGRPGYLTLDFFLSIAQSMPNQILLASAHQDSTEQEMLAAALYFRDSSTLYGRYWGALEDMDGLHFEACYYQGIEYAIKQGIQRFDPGAQGEHKIQRGFTPVLTRSYHKIVHPGFQNAIDQFVANEKNHIHQYCLDARSYLPFREEVEIPSTDYLLKPTSTNHD